MDSGRGGWYTRGGTAWINEQDLHTWQDSGRVAAANHEIGHLFGLNERYHHPPNVACNDGDWTVMDAIRFELDGGCDTNYPTSNDLTRVQTLYEAKKAESPGYQQTGPGSVNWTWSDQTYAESEYGIQTQFEDGSVETFVTRHWGVAPGRPPNPVTLSSGFSTGAGDVAGWYRGCIETVNSVFEASEMACTPWVYLDADSDSDGIYNLSDNCDFVQNQNQADSDGDLVGNVCDSCPQTPDTPQYDYDLDGIAGVQPAAGDQFGGDACDPDDDADGYSDRAELFKVLCANSVNDDGVVFGGSDDTRVNDGCPAVGAAETACTDTLDNDNDGYYNDGCPKQGSWNEGDFTIGSSPYHSCTEGSQEPSFGWPPDFESGGSSYHKITLADITSFTVPAPRRLNTSPGEPAFNVRWDLIPGRGGFNSWINLSDLTSTTGGGLGTRPPMFGGEKVFNGPQCQNPPFP